MSITKTEPPLTACTRARVDTVVCSKKHTGAAKPAIFILRIVLVTFIFITEVLLSVLILALKTFVIANMYQTRPRDNKVNKSETRACPTIAKYSRVLPEVREV